MKSTLVAFGIFIALVAGVSFQGCIAGQASSPQVDVSQVRQQTVAIREALQVAINKKMLIDEQIRQLPPVEREKGLRESEKIGQVIVGLQEVLNTFHENTANADSTLDVIDAGAAAAAPMFGPYGVMAGLAITTITGFARAWQNRKAGRAIARSVDPLVDSAIRTEPSMIAALRKDQGSTGNRIVDEAQGKAFKMPF